MVMGDSRKYPYPTIGGMNILNTLAFQNSKVIIPLPLHFYIFAFYSNPQESQVWLPTTSNEREFALFTSF